MDWGSQVVRLVRMEGRGLFQMTRDTKKNGSSGDWRFAQQQAHTARGER